MNRRGDGRGIAGKHFRAGPFVRLARPPTDGRDTAPGFLADTFPNCFSRRRIERHYARVSLPADHDDQLVSFEERRAADAEERLGHVPFLRCVALPNQFAVAEVQAEEFSLRTEGVATV